MSDSKKNEHLQPRSKFGQLFIVNLLRLFLGSILLFFVLAAFGLGAVRLWLGPEIESTITSKEKFDIYLP